MEHVVFFPAPDGTAAFRRVVSLEDAVRFVEHLRNVEGIDQFSVHALTEVPLAFKAYYRVEVPAEGAPTAEGPATEAPVEETPDAEAAPAEAPTPEDAPVVVPEQEQPVAAAAPAKSSMGFFSRG